MLRLPLSILGYVRRDPEEADRSCMTLDQKTQMVWGLFVFIESIQPVPELSEGSSETGSANPGIDWGKSRTWPVPNSSVSLLELSLKEDQGKARVETRACCHAL